MKWIWILGYWLLCSQLSAWAGNTIFVDDVRSLTAIVNGDWMNRPIMQLGTTDRMTIGFDQLTHNYHRLVYHIEHCEADWTPSDGLFDSDWLIGFNDNTIEDYQNSINTIVQYTHYQLSIPNERCQLKMSGNYRLTVYDEDQDNEKLLSVEFYVVEPMAAIGLDIKTNTDIDHNQSHQQIAMTVDLTHLNVTNIEDQIETIVMQNWDERTARRNIRPNFINTNLLQWQHSRDMIFNAGNEYHKFEVLDVSHTTMGLDHIEWDGHNYQVWPFPVVERINYLTDADADGAFIIRNSNNREINYTCDYVWVNFQVLSPFCGDLFIDGQWTTDYDRSHYIMKYDDIAQCYTARVMLKQGYYNYRIVTDKGLLAPLEGNFYETENRYQALVYYRGSTDRTWRLVGVSLLTAADSYKGSPTSVYRVFSYQGR